MAATTLGQMLLKTLISNIEGLKPILLEYLATPPTLTDGQTCVAQCNSAGALTVDASTSNIASITTVGTVNTVDSVTNVATVASVTAQPSIDSSPIYQQYAAGGALGTDADLVTDGGSACRQIKVYTGGDITLVRPDDSSVTIASVPDGDTLNVQAKTITSATTTAQDIVVLW